MGKTFDPFIELADTSVEGNEAADQLAVKTAIELGIPVDMAEKMIGTTIDLEAEDEEESNFPDTGEYDEEREDHVRKELGTWVAYAESGPSYDPKGGYECGKCDMRYDSDKCTHVEGTISFDAGSCRLFILGPELEGKPPLKHQLTQIEAQYGERPKTKAFGCQNCEYGAEAKKPDSKGRKSWCTYFGLHVIPTACCAMEEGEDSVGPKDINAYGTSEGVEKSWDTRGRKHNLPGVDYQELKNKWETLAQAIDMKDKDDAGYCAALAGKLYTDAFAKLPGWGIYSGYATEEDEHVFIAGHGYIVDVSANQFRGGPSFQVYKDDGKIYRAEGVAWEKQDKKSIGYMVNEYDDLVKQNKKQLEAATEVSLEGEQKGALWNGVKLTGFTGPEEEGLRAMLSRIPPELFTNVVEIKAAPELNAKHGRFLPETKTVEFNPANFTLRQRFGKGEGWIYHAELTVVHEIGHSIYSVLTPLERDEWLYICGWQKGWKEGQSLAYVESRPGWEPGTSAWTHKAGVEMPRYYSEKNPNECFADCFAFFLLGKAHQMSKDIRAFMEQYIKDHVKRYPQALIQSPTK